MAATLFLTLAPPAFCSSHRHGWTWKQGVIVQTDADSKTVVLQEPNSKRELRLFWTNDTREWPEDTPLKKHGLLVNSTTLTSGKRILALCQNKHGKTVALRLILCQEAFGTH